MHEILPDFLKNKAENMGHFKLPDGYFDTLPDRFFEQINASDSTFLDTMEIKKTNTFQVPTDYFEKLPDRVFEKIEAKQALGKTVDLPVKKSFLPTIGRRTMLAAAASVALIIGFGLFFGQKTIQQSPEIACNTTCLSEKITEADVQFYLSQNLADFNSEELSSADLVGELEIKSVKKSPEMDVQAAEAGSALHEMLDDLNVEDLEKMW